MSETAQPRAQSHRPSAGPSPGLRRVLRDDETLRWSSKPVKRAWYVGHLVGFPLGFALVIALVGGPFAAFYYVAEGGFGIGLGTVLTYGGGAYLLLTVLVAVSGLLAYRHAEMALTDDRVVRLGGIVGRDASTVSLSDVRDVNVRVMPWDKVFGTGRLELQVAGGPGYGVRMSYVADPHDVLQRIEAARKQAEEAAASDRSR